MLRDPIGAREREVMREVRREEGVRILEGALAQGGHVGAREELREPRRLPEADAPGGMRRGDLGTRRSL